MTITKIKKEYNKFDVKMVLTQGKIETLIKILDQRSHFHPLVEELRYELICAWQSIPDEQKIM